MDQEETPPPVDWWVYQGWAPAEGVFNEQPEPSGLYPDIVVSPTIGEIPLPAGIWLFTSAVLALVVVSRRNR